MAPGVRAVGPRAQSNNPGAGKAACAGQPPTPDREPVSKKLIVIRSSTDEKVPFLRGVLVQSLTDVGLPFEDAYAVAQGIREELERSEGITTPELRQLVAKDVEKRFGQPMREAYEAGREADREILVHSPTRERPFSVGILSRQLRGCAIGTDEALEAARSVQEVLRRRAILEIEHRDLRRVIFETLGEEISTEAAERFLSRCRFEDSGEPLILLIGGATGTGKSTVTSELAYLLSITRTQSTDIMREIIRCYLVPHVAPTLAYSSFDAWRGLPEVEPLEGQMISDNPVVTGFLSQFGTVKVALEATIHRAIQERHHLIVDGVHVLPSRLDLKGTRKKAVVVTAMLVVTTIERLSRQITHRSREQPERSSSLHRDRIDSIWELQSFFIDQAERAAIPVIANWSVDETVQQIVREVMAEILARYPPDEAALG